MRWRLQRPSNRTGSAHGFLRLGVEEGVYILAPVSESLENEAQNGREK